VLQDAFAQLEPVTDPLGAQIAEGARHAQELGFAPPGNLDGLVDDAPLAEARTAPPPGSRRARTP
jgi:hypothetical protein